jgi:signal transduction histidine kinase
VVKSTGDLLRGISGEEQEELLDMHGEAVERLETLVQSILAVAGKAAADEEQQRHGLREFVEGMIRPWHRRWTGTRDVPLAVRIDACPGAWTEIEEARLDSILDSLHTNAWTACEATGARVWTNVYLAPSGWWPTRDHLSRLAAYRDSESGPGPGSAPALPSPPVDGAERFSLVIEVVDLGCGIPEHEIDRIFEPFSQASNSSLLGVAGRGMGLATAARLAESVSGEIRIQSGEGEGTIAALLLPAIRD